MLLAVMYILTHKDSVMAKVKQRLYACNDCGNERLLTTNHEGECYPICTGKCRDIIYPHTAREVVLTKQTAHHFVGNNSTHKEI